MQKMTHKMQRHDDELEKKLLTVLKKTENKLTNQTNTKTDELEKKVFTVFEEKIK